MCGIAGAFNSSLALDTLQTSLASLSHRGPDSTSYLTLGPFIGGMVRLSINDILGGDQPFISQDSNIIVFYNGEIYNSHRLRNYLESLSFKFSSTSDGEVIPYLFQLYGPKAFDMLDGMFSISLFDKSSQSLYLARDRSGEKPLYYHYCRSSQSLYYASELKALTKILPFSPSLNHQSVDLPTFLWIPQPDTIYEDISSLESGTYIKISLDSFDNISYVCPNKFDISSISDLESYLFSLLDQSVQDRLISDVPVGCFLSGGLDSSIITYLASAC